MVTIDSVSALLLRYFNNFPAFVPAAMRAGAVGELRLMAIRALGYARRTQGIMSAAIRGAPFGVSSLRVWHFAILLQLYSLQGRPAIVYRLHFAPAILQVTILAAHRTNTMAGLAADPLHGHRKKNVLPQDIIQE